MEQIVLPNDEKETTSEKLLKLAANLFREKGYSASTTRELASQLGIQKASLYYHISKKEDLLYAMCVESLQNIYQAVEQALSECNDPLESLKVLIKAHMRAALTDQNKHAVMLIELHQLSPERKQEVMKLRDSYEALVRRTLAQAQSAGVIRQDFSAKYLELALLNLLNWSIFWYKPGGELEIEQLAEMLATIFLQGTILVEPFKIVG
jgi:AcrR family transcriptional regulator